MATSSDALPNVAAGDILELQPNGQLFDFTPGSATSPAAYDNLASYTPSDSNVYDIQTGSSINLSDPPTGSPVDLANATFGDFGVDGSSLVVSAESNDWDFVMRVTYGTGRAGDRHDPGRIAGKRRAHRVAGGCRRRPPGDRAHHAALSAQRKHHGDPCPGRIQSLF